MLLHSNNSGFVSYRLILFYQILFNKFNMYLYYSTLSFVSRPLRLFQKNDYNRLEQTDMSIKNTIETTRYVCNICDK